MQSDRPSVNECYFGILAFPVWLEVNEALGPVMIGNTEADKLTRTRPAVQLP